MELLSEEEKQNIIRELRERGAKLPCPRCGHDKFVISDGYFFQSIQKGVRAAMVVGGSVIPQIAIICQNCGFMSFHALGIVGLLPKEKNE